MKVWRFSIQDKHVLHGGKTRKKLTSQGCNEPFKDRFWCPRLQWFRNEACPFIDINECETYEAMCGGL